MENNYSECNTVIDNIEQKLYDEYVKNITKEGKYYKYKKIYLYVDSEIDKHSSINYFSIKEVKLLGNLGWKVVAVIPKTEGFLLENISIGSTFGVTHGGALGGSIQGVYLLLEKIETIIMNKEEFVKDINNEEFELDYFVMKQSCKIENEKKEIYEVCPKCKKKSLKKYNVCEYCGSYKR